MNLEVLEARNMTIEQAIDHQDELYFIYFASDGKPTLAPFGQVMFDKRYNKIQALENKLLLKIDQNEATEKDIPVKDPEKRPRKTYERRTYKLDCICEGGAIEIESRIDGSIRVNFKDKESAQLYRDHFRDMFYKHNTDADWLTVSTIYKECRAVNWESKNCDDWAWPTVDYGTVRYITDVLKTKNKKMYGFTFTPPKKLYGTTTS